MVLSEKEFQKQVIEVAKMCGWHVYHFADSRRQVKPGVFVGDAGSAGFPDLVLVRDRVMFAELKTDKGRLRPKQIECLDALEKAGAEVYVWRPKDFDTILCVLKK